MATAKKTAKPAAKTAVAVRSNNSLVSVKEMMAKQIAEIAEKTEPASGTRILVTQDKQFVLPDGTKTRDPLKLVIVDFISRNEFYPGQFDKDNIVPPACFAIGKNPKTLAPSDNSPEKQADTCTECPNNVFGSKNAGKACNNTRLMAVLPPDANDDTPLWTLKASATAIRGFDGYVNSVVRTFGVAPFGVITTVSFDDSKDYPSLKFSEPELNEGADACLSRFEEASKLLAQEPDVSGYNAEPPKKVAAKKAVHRAPATARR